MWLAPRLFGRKGTMLAVNAEKGWRGSPNLSNDSGWTWNSRSAVFTSGLDLANIPNWLGAIDMGPLRDNTYSSPMPKRPKRVPARWFRVATFSTLKATRNWRWSCRFSPTSSDWWTILIPALCKYLGLPIPDSSRIWGEPIAPAQRRTSRFVWYVMALPLTKTSTPQARFPVNITRCTCACVMTVKLTRFFTGFKKPFDVFHRHPFFWFTRKYEEPSLSPRLKSSIFSIPACWAASR